MFKYFKVLKHNHRLKMFIKFATYKHFCQYDIMIIQLIDYAI